MQRGESWKKTNKQNICYLNCAAPPMRANLEPFPKANKKKQLGRSQLRGTETTYVYLLCYLFISDRVHYK